MTYTLDGQPGPTNRYNGQTAKHAAEIALEDLARTFRIEAEAEQNIDWESVDRWPSGEVNEMRFHVILHYERITEEQSKFDAMQNTVMGNTVIENAEISIIQVDPDLAIESLER